MNIWSEDAGKFVEVSIKVSKMKVNTEKKPKKIIIYSIWYIKIYL